MPHSPSSRLGVRLVTLAALVLVAAAAAVVLLGPDGDVRYRVRLADASQLVRGNEVRVAGRTVGSVESVELSGDGRAEVTFDVRPPVAPLRAGARVTVRAASLTGVANRYLAITPGPSTALRLPEGSTLASTAATPVVELDAVVSTFDPASREGLRQVLRGLDRQLDGRGEEANLAAANLDPALQAVRRLSEDLNADGTALRRFVANSAALVQAVGSRRDALAGSVDHAAQALEAVGAEDEALRRALAAAPGALRSTTSGLAELRRSLPDLEAVLAEADRAAGDLTPFLRELRPTLTASRPVLADLAPAIAGPGGDLTDLLRRAPRLAAASRRASPATSVALADATPIVTFARPYAPDLAGLLRDVGQASAAYDANGHYARIQPVFNAFAPAGEGGALVPRADERRLDGFETLQLRRCPGGALAPRADGSAPWRDADGALDCDPSTAPGAG